MSQGCFATLNFSVTVGDDPGAVAENLARAARQLGITPERISYLCQVHGTTTRTVDSGLDIATIRSTQGDVVLSRDPRVACAVRVADCAPILLADRISGAVAAVHSGWRGTASNVVTAAVRALHQLVASRFDIIAAVGPHIESCCFEVGDEVVTALRHASSDQDIVRPGKRNRAHVDLRRVIHAQLLEAGVNEASIDHVRGCTMCDATRFFSFRRDGPRGGRHLSAIVARAEAVS